MINLKDILTKYPECKSNSQKLKGILVDLYPSEKVKINILITILTCGIADQMSKPDGCNNLAMTSYANRLENEFGYSPKFIGECLSIWQSYSDKDSDNLTFELSWDKKSYILTTVKDKTIVNLSIPSVYKGLPVTHIGTMAFAECGLLTKVCIPNSIISIGKQAFDNCVSLSNITIPNSVKDIGHWAFAGCIGLTNIAIPDSVVSLGCGAFSSYDEEYDELLTPCVNLKSVTIGNGVQCIDKYTFYGCESLESVSIGNSVTHIADYAFSGCNRLTNINIPPGLTHIGYLTFSCCNSLHKIFIPRNVAEIESDAFEYCDNLTIYCEVNEKPIGWEEYYSPFEPPWDWNSSNCPVVWGYKGNTTNLSNIAVGNIVTLGMYPQGKNSTKTSIKWQVLDVFDEHALLISKYGLDCKPFDTRDVDVTWENCTLRKWLNNNFYNMAFSSTDKQKISLVDVPVHKNPNYSTAQGNATQDHVFLLSAVEAQKYFANDEKRKCTPTAYAVKNGAWTSYDDGATWWWLRTCGESQRFATFVPFFGMVNARGYDMKLGNCAVRPVIMIKL